MDWGFVGNAGLWGTGISLISLAVSVMAFRHSKLVQRVALPAPECDHVQHGIVRLRMRKEDAPRFAISDVKYINQRIQRVMSDDRPEGMATVRRYGRIGEPADRISLHPPLTDVMITMDMLLSRDIHVRVVSRAEPSISAWIVVKG